MMSEERCNPSGFVEFVFRRSNQKDDTAFSAIMRRADNPTLCSTAWEYLVPFCNIENDHQRLAFALVGAAIAREKAETDGPDSLGTVFQKICQGDADAMERESRRFRRLIACGTMQELIPVLRPILKYLQGKLPAMICYDRLLKDLIFWNENIRIRWTREFYNKLNSENNEE